LKRLAWGKWIKRKDSVEEHGEDVLEIKDKNPRKISITQSKGYTPKPWFG